MFPLLGGLISGGASLLGSIFSSNTSAQNTQQQIAAQQQMQTQSEDFNAGQAQLNRDFQQQMSSTAYQRASSDMKAAGLNPMMMFGSGGAESTPGGSTASVGTPNVPMPQTKSPLGDLGQNVAAGLSAAISAKTIDAMTAEIAKKDMDTKLAAANIDVAAQEARKKNFEGTNVSLDTAQHRLAATTAENILDMPSEELKYMNIGQYMQKQFGGIVGGVVGSAKTAYDAAKKGIGNFTRARDAGASFSDRFNAAYGNDAQQ